MTEKTPTRLAEYLRVNHAGERAAQTGSNKDGLT